MRLPLRYRPTPWDLRVESVCSSWEGTPYRLNGCVKGAGVDCIHFGAAVLDELYGTEHSRDLKSLPPDACIHNREGVITAARALFTKYPAMERVGDGSVEAGDLVLLGRATALNTTQHLLVCGADSGLWHADRPRVHRTGFSVAMNLKLVCVYRATDKQEKWPC